jgi:transcriptional regulator with XRE-family HTH domain
MLLTAQDRKQRLKAVNQKSGLILPDELHEVNELQQSSLQQQEHAAMPRTLSKPRPPQGAHLAALRQDAGLSQYELAALVGEPQANIAFWERSAKPPRSDVLPKLAQVLGVRVEELLLIETAHGKTASATTPRHNAPSGNGPKGKVRQVFEEVSTLPRTQQQRILDVVQAMIQAQRPQSKATPNS